MTTTGMEAHRLGEAVRAWLDAPQDRDQGFYSLLVRDIRDAALAIEPLEAVAYIAAADWGDGRGWISSPKEHRTPAEAWDELQRYGKGAIRTRITPLCRGTPIERERPEARGKPEREG